jgi:putative tributyrin esterase
MQNTDFDYTYAEGPGAHTWSFWDKWVKKAIKWMLEGR